MALKLVLVGPRGTVFKDDKIQRDLTLQLFEFIRRMHARGVKVALWSQHLTTVNRTNGAQQPLETWLSEKCGFRVTYYRAAHGELPVRATKDSAAPILAAEGAEKHETILVGNEESDLRAGVNNKLLLVRPEWYESELKYGFAVRTIAELARFCELFGLRKHPIYWSVDDGLLQARAMGPFSTIKPDFAEFGESAKSAAKFGTGDSAFWFWMIVSSLYFSGLMHKADHITRFPGHNPLSFSKADKGLDAVLSVLGKCFGRSYLPNLLVRHVASTKSQPIPAANRTFRNHLNTLHLNRNPKRNEREVKAPIQLKSKTVLIVDDICTSGRSLDVARALIESAGGNAILFSWLKTINTSFTHMTADPVTNPFNPASIASEPSSTTYPYHSNIIAPDAPTEIDQLLSAFKSWKWP